MMLLIAITLVLVGLLCFIYVSLNPSTDRERLGFKIQCQKGEIIRTSLDQTYVEARR
ncbi:hypothetical protein LEP1GSC124_0434, partial [Leptospira interrogans serovar Pyrogenes str. 200701872]